MKITPKPGSTTPRVLPDQRTAVFPRFTAEGDHDDLGVWISMEVEVDEWGTARCAELTIRPLRDESVTWQTLRSVPVDRLLGEAKAAAASWFAYASPGVFELPSTQERVEIRREVAKGARRPRRGSRTTEAHLREVADVYREALAAGKPPTKAIGAHWYVTPPTASRWVAKAREVGFLGPATHGRASA
jgi:hypothetical protein